MCVCAYAHMEHTYRKRLHAIKARIERTVATVPLKWPKTPPLQRIMLDIVSRLSVLLLVLLL